MVSYPRILFKSNSDELWTSLKSSPELCSNKVLMPGKWICFISLLWTFYIYLCILQFLYSGSSNSKYNEFLVLCSYLISFTDSICYLFSVLSISLFPFISISISDLSCRYLSMNIELVPPSTSFSKSYSKNNSDPTSNLRSSKILGQEPERGTAHNLKPKSLPTSYIQT